ncbi:MAG: CPBP family intramembrane metalloprotease [Lachnospiraceae bacterium]|jgi:membrane protease YdiL (CAAX protease family)|nr:CPBP family intramembrane metalloprotease [Lachnospiraceae bacterium]MBQ3973608.1 CPBP family intramembrane metalloprotease [Lachnospiraceae bacterium]MBQ4303494.1 CPBP family intramembrane metalloprotease [Lachnospiraceae bacterium]MBQ5361482.1 CPBP family intramembrane metalloprotease [Lachnospiraceae bacterium]
MFKFAYRHPVIFEVILFIGGLILTVFFMIPVQAVTYASTEISSSLGRLAASLVLFLIFIRFFRPKRLFTGLPIMLPALLFALWNVFNCFVTGGGNVTAPDPGILVMSLAPAVFEEIIFREISIHNLEKAGHTPRQTLILSAAVFALVHLTNAVGGAPLQSLVQAGYAFVVGLVFGAVYIVSGDLFAVILAHLAVDLSNHIFPGGSVTPVPVIIAFLVLLSAQAAYAFFLIRGREKEKV